MGGERGRGGEGGEPPVHIPGYATVFINQLSQ